MTKEELKEKAKNYREYICYYAEKFVKYNLSEKEKEEVYKKIETSALMLFWCFCNCLYEAPSENRDVSNFISVKKEPENDEVSKFCPFASTYGQLKPCQKECDLYIVPDDSEEGCCMLKFFALELSEICKNIEQAGDSCQ